MNRYLSWSEAVNSCKKSSNAFVIATVIGTQGSTPRDSGSKMVITEDTAYDTLGGGQLEFAVIHRARELINVGEQTQVLEYIPLSAKVNQCCGGMMTVLLECIAAPEAHIHVFGAGHVGRALVGILSQLDVVISWVDGRVSEFPDEVSTNVNILTYSNIVEHVQDMPKESIAIILTHQHSLDYDLVEALLDRKDCRYIGLIGSKTKAMRFRRRLQGAAFSQAEIDTVICPIGLAEVSGKLPIEVAVSISAQVMPLIERKEIAGEEHADPEYHTSDSACGLQEKAIENRKYKKTTGLLPKELSRVLIK